MIFSTGQCIIYRHRQILPIGHWLRVEWATISIIFAFHYLFYDLAFVHTLSYGKCELNGPALKNKILEEYPQYIFVREYDDFFFGDASGFYPLTGLTIQINAAVIAILMGVESLIFGVFFFWHAFYMLDRNLYLSQQTRRLQSKMLKGLIFQLLIPYMTLLYPGAFISGVQAIGSVLFFHMIFSTGQCIIYRHRQILPIGHPLRVEWSTITFLFIIHYLFFDVSFVHTLFMAQCELNGAALREQILEEYPQYSFVRNYDDFFFGAAPGIYPLTGLTLRMNAALIAILMGVESLVFGVFFFWHAFWMLDKNLSLSPQTRRLQLKLLKGLLFQLLIPYMTLLYPGIFISGVQIFQLNMDQGLLSRNFCKFPTLSYINFAFWCNSTHATISSISILIFAEPYKRYLIQLIVMTRKQFTKAKVSVSIGHGPVPRMKPQTPR
ncbi:unnamed protein product, partial [Mesorhabditis spiculigera]